jgi:ABC-type phosphate transport system substrate-binding protein
MRNLQIAAAVALAIGGHSAAQAAQTPAACAAAGATLYVAGSSAAQPSFGTALAADLFDAGGETVISATGGNGNFKAYCGAAKAGNGAGVPTGTIVTVYYRGEGGSVVGVLPIVSGKPVKQLDLSQPSCQIAGPVVNGTSATVGTTDAWSGCVTNHVVEMGVSDLEPTVFTSPNYPSAYSTTVFGTASKAQLAALVPVPLFQQVFGLFVNTSGINGGASGQAIDLTRETAANILEGNYVNWNAVPTASGGVVSSTSQPITIVNREAGSGTRTGATIYFLGTNCSTAPGTLLDPTPATDGYATGDVLSTAATTPGAITYASIDNNGKQPALTMASINGVAPDNLKSTSGTYDWWFEATAQKGTITSPGGTGIYNWLTGGELSNIATAPHVKHIMAIPNTSNIPLVPVTGSASLVNGVTIYINPFTKSGNSCSIPFETN